MTSRCTAITCPSGTGPLTCPWLTTRYKRAPSGRCWVPATCGSTSGTRMSPGTCGRMKTSRWAGTTCWPSWRHKRGPTACWRSHTRPRLPPRPDVPSPAAFPRLVVILRRKAVEIPRCVLRCLKRVRAAGNVMTAAHRRILCLPEGPELYRAGPRARVRHVIGQMRNVGHYAVVDEDAVGEVFRLPGYLEVPDRPFAGDDAAPDYRHGSKSQACRGLPSGAASA